MSQAIDYLDSDIVVKDEEVKLGRSEHGAKEFVLPEDFKNNPAFEEKVKKLIEYVGPLLKDTDKEPYPWQYQAATML